MMDRLINLLLLLASVCASLGTGGWPEWAAVAGIAWEVVKEVVPLNSIPSAYCLCIAKIINQRKFQIVLAGLFQGLTDSIAVDHFILPVVF